MTITAKAFKKMRKDKGYTQAGLAREFGISSITISRWERGAWPIPRLPELALTLLTPRPKPKKGGK
jgi:transcriptional regulator with XRE-family HTH domain